jgi:hypothetical protein
MMMPFHLLWARDVSKQAAIKTAGGAELLAAAAALPTSAGTVEDGGSTKKKKKSKKRTAAEAAGDAAEIAVGELPIESIELLGHRMHTLTEAGA